MLITYVSLDAYAYHSAARQVAGTSGKVRLDDSEEEGLSTEAQGAAIIEALGLAQRNQVRQPAHSPAVMLAQCTPATRQFSEGTLDPSWL